MSAVAQDPRTVARRLRRFTITDFARAVGLSRTVAADKVWWMVAEVGMLEATDEYRKHGGPGRPAQVFEYIEPPPHTAPRPRRKPPEVELMEQAKKKADACPRTAPPKKKRRIPNPEIRELVEAAREVGWGFQQTGSHYWLTPPPTVQSDKIRLPTTPSDHRAVKNARAMMRRAGIPV